MRDETVLRALINAVAASAELGTLLSNTTDPVPGKRLKERYRRRERQAREFEGYLMRRMADVYTVTRADVQGILDGFLPSDCAGLGRDEIDRLCEQVAEVLAEQVPAIIEAAISDYLLMRAAYPQRGQA